MGSISDPVRAGLVFKLRHALAATSPGEAASG